MSATTDLAAWRASLVATLHDDAGNRPVVTRESSPRTPRMDVLSFCLRGETYAILIDEVTEILLPKPITPLPRAPAFVKGVLSLRGAVLPVLDLAARLGVAPGQATRSSRILVLRDGEEHVGFWVDEVTGVVRFSQGDVGTTDFSSSVDPLFLTGIGYDRRGTLVAVLRSEALCDFSVGSL